jgi:Zn-dependent peptidase ImmA (M78 family)
MTVKRIPSTKDSKKFWDAINKSKERTREDLAKLTFEKKIEILEQMQRDRKELLKSRELKLGEIDG